MIWKVSHYRGSHRVTSPDAFGAAGRRFTEYGRARAYHLYLLADDEPRWARLMSRTHALMSGFISINEWYEFHYQHCRRFADALMRVSITREKSWAMLYFVTPFHFWQEIDILAEASAYEAYGLWHAGVDASAASHAADTAGVRARIHDAVNFDAFAILYRRFTLLRPIPLARHFIMYACYNAYSQIWWGNEKLHYFMWYTVEKSLFALISRRYSGLQMPDLLVSPWLSMASSLSLLKCISQKSAASLWLPGISHLTLLSWAGWRWKFH